EKAIELLMIKYKCHTVILYGSRARGDANFASDYDIMGVRKTGKKMRIAKMFNDAYLDSFIFPEKDLKVIDENFLYMKGAKVLHQKDQFGTLFIKKLNSALKKKYRPLPSDEIEARRFWLHKMLERIKLGDLEGLYRRSWLQEALLADYFNIRKLRYWGSKESFKWLMVNDKKTYLLFKKTLENPSDFKNLKKLVEQVSEIKLPQN
ncbi:MAG: nucleotidyltransferase domain-containing protein, partial [Bdellovibrionales bacterium]|nr:nucleotidyltransferase domain-containing protein [Bdellovibrionales bacterium]